MTQTITDVAANIQARLEEVETQIGEKRREYEQQTASLKNEQRMLTAMMKVYERTTNGETTATPSKKHRTRNQAENRWAEVTQAFREIGATSPEHAVNSRTLAAHLRMDPRGSAVMLTTYQRAGRPIHGDRDAGYWLGEEESE